MMDAIVIFLVVMAITAIIVLAMTDDQDATEKLRSHNMDKPIRRWDSYRKGRYK